MAETRIVALKARSLPSLGDSMPSLHSRVVAELRRAIVERRFMPGDRLIEGRLAEELGVSRIPVREAIRVLASEGLVELTARRGAAVARFSIQEARETIELRALLEGQNARLAARRRDKQVLKRIGAVLEKGLAAQRAGQLDLLVDLNRQYHRELGSAAQNSVMAELLARLRARTEMLFTPADAAEQSRAWGEHADILRAIIEGDEQSAASLASAHVTRAGENFLAQQPPEEPARSTRRTVTAALAGRSVAVRTSKRTAL